MVALDLDNLSVSLRLPNTMALDDQSVALLGSHVGLLCS
jgi:hypothetical protein